MTKQNRGELKVGELHPSAFDAKDYLLSLGVEKLMTYLEAYSSCAIEGNRHAEICGETLNRLLNGQPVSDRYLLGLSWSIKFMEDKAKENSNEQTNISNSSKKIRRSKKTIKRTK